MQMVLDELNENVIGGVIGLISLLGGYWLKMVNPIFGVYPFCCL